MSEGLGRTTIVVCRRSGADPVSCGLVACENGCDEIELEFVRAHHADALAAEMERLLEERKHRIVVPIGVTKRARNVLADYRRATDA